MIWGNSPLYFSGHAYSTHREKHRAKQAVHKATKAQADLDLARAQEDLATFKSTKEVRQRIQHLALQAKESGLTHDVGENKLNQALFMSDAEIELSKKTGKIRQQAALVETETQLVRAVHDKQTAEDMFGTKAAEKLLKKLNDEHENEQTRLGKDKKTEAAAEEEGRNKFAFYS